MENPSGVIATPLISTTSFGRMKPYVLLARIPKTMSASPIADSAPPTTSIRGMCSGRGLGLRRPRKSRMTTTMTTSPTNTRRQV